jgi:hypothetical protein
MESFIANSSMCSVCGNIRGCHGKPGYPKGYPGELGPCGHEESRGPRGRIKTKDDVEESIHSQQGARRSPILETNYTYCKKCGGPLRIFKLNCQFCGSSAHLECK